MEARLNRREFIGVTATASAGLAMGVPPDTRAAGSELAKPALLGGPKAHPGTFPGWPVFDQTEEKALLDVVKSGNWFRGSGKAVVKFEEEYKKLTGAKHCLATSCGTSALTTVLGALEVGPGDEVIIPPYTFIATYNVVALNYALPIFVDSDLESFQIDANKIEAAITKQTKAIMPVHVGGSAADLDKILAVGRKHNVPVIEDACQAHLGEWRGRKVGTLGLAGCFSFQASKNLNSGEGGAILTDDDRFAGICFNFHNQGRGRAAGGYNFSYSGTRGSNLRLAEFQGAMLVAQMSRLTEQTRRRTENAAYLTQLLKEIPGILPAKLYDGVTRSAFHLYMFRYDKARFAGLERDRFIAALSKEGVPCSAGYGPMNRDTYVQGLAKNKGFLKVYGEQGMKQWLDRSHCPENDKLCAQAVWFTQGMLLSSRTDMEQIAEAIRKIQKHASALAKS